MTTITRASAIAELTAQGQPYALQTKSIEGRSLRVFEQAPPSLRALFANAVSDKTFLIYNDERLSFAQSHAQAARIAHVLVHDFGVQHGDRIAISMRNYPEWVLAFMAITSVGGIAVAMNALWQPDELAYGLRDSGSQVLFADSERIERLSRCSKRPAVRVIGVRTDQTEAGVTPLSDLLARVGDVPMPSVEVAPDDAATIFYTSGSTGHPKGVLSTHRAILSALLSWELDAYAAAKVAGITLEPPTEQGGSLMAVPFFHVTGSHAIFLSSYRAQRKLVCMYKWDPALGAELIERERLTSFIAPAAMTGDLVRFAREGRRDLSSLLAVGGGGAPRAPEQVGEIGRAFGQAFPGTGWGMTETNAIGVGIGGQDYLDRPASSGRCSAVMDLKIVDEAGYEVPTGARGELLVRGAGMFSGYWNRPDVNAEMIDEDGWFRTGDIAVFDDEGYLFIVDRSKDLIIRGGENIGCGAVEAALLEHPLVHEAAVYAVPDDRLGEEVGATLHCDASLSVESLREFLKDRLAQFEMPRYIRTHAEPLPRTPSGKIFKRQLRDEAVAELQISSHPDKESQA
jgi:long-chain acyl-CoA synthetase